MPQQKITAISSQGEGRPVHAVLELILGVVVWMAVAAMNQLGVQVNLPKEEPAAERVIQRDPPAGARKADARLDPCPTLPGKAVESGPSAA